MAAPHRILLLLTSDLTDEECIRRAVERPDREVAVHCAVPPLPRRLNFAVTTDDRRELPQAGERLDATLRMLHARGITATGRLGDLSAKPAQLIDDAIAYFHPDELVLVVHPTEEKQWAEDGLVDDAVHRYALPVTIVECAETRSAAA